MLDKWLQEYSVYLVNCGADNSISKRAKWIVVWSSSIVLLILNGVTFAASNPCSLIDEWYLAAQAGIEGHEPKKRQQLEALESQCEGSEGARSSCQNIGCALVLGDLLNQPDLLHGWKRHRLWRHYSQSALNERGLTPFQRAHLERTAPLIYRPNWKAALVGLEWLQRSEPGVQSLLWKADTQYRQGNMRAAVETESEALLLSPSALSARARWTKPADGFCQGIHPRLGLNTWSGLVVGVGVCGFLDENASTWETDGQISTRGNILARAGFSEEGWLSPHRVRMATHATRVKDDLVDIVETRRVDVLASMDWSLGSRPFGPYMSTGLRLSALESTNSFALPAPVAGVLGPTLEWGWNHQDSDFFSKSGWKVIVKQFGNLRSDSIIKPFLQQKWEAEWIWNFSSHWRKRVAVQSLLNWGPSTYHHWAVPGSNLYIPAVRPYRYADKNLLLFTLSPEFDVLRSLTIAPVFSLTVSPGKAAPWKAGGALSLIWFFSRDRRWFARVDSGFFAGEWTVQVASTLLNSF